MSEQSSDRQLLRDLEWAVASPPLMRGGTRHSLVADGGCLPNHAARYSGHRVGYYFESLIDHCLRCGDGVEMLASGLQVRDGGRTIGELDFVFRDRQGRVCHWEVAVKFYLYCADWQVAGSHFIGPMPAIPSNENGIGSKGGNCRCATAFFRRWTSVRPW